VKDKIRDDFLPLARISAVVQQEEDSQSSTRRQIVFKKEKVASQWQGKEYTTQ